MIIQSIEVLLPANAMSFEDKVYRAHLDNGEELDLFRECNDAYLPPETLIGLTPDAARNKRAIKMKAAMYCGNRLTSLISSYCPAY